MHGIRLYLLFDALQDLAILDYASHAVAEIAYKVRMLAVRSLWRVLSKTARFRNQFCTDAVFIAALLLLQAIPSITIGAAPLVCEWEKDCVVLDGPPTKFVELGNVATEDEVWLTSFCFVC